MLQNEEELALLKKGCQSKHQLQIVSERSARDLGAGTSVGAQLLIRSHPNDGTCRERGRKREKQRFKARLFFYCTFYYAVCVAAALWLWLEHFHFDFSGVSPSSRVHTFTHGFLGDIAVRLRRWRCLSPNWATRST